MATLALGGASQGFIQTETMRAFTEEEAGKIFASLPWSSSCDAPEFLAPS